MVVSHMDLVVRKERNKDLLREAERERLAGAARSSAGAGAGLLRKVAAWFSAPRVSADPFPSPPTLTPATGK